MLRVFEVETPEGTEWLLSDDHHAVIELAQATGLTVTRVLDLLDVPHAAVSWQGLPDNGGA